MTKDAVRSMAADLRLRTAAKADSQDVCFIHTRRGRAGFLGDRLPLTPGRVVDRGGAEVGSVDAVELVTVGQRRGLDMGGSAQRQFALDVDVVSRTVTVGGARAAARRAHRRAGGALDRRCAERRAARTDVGSRRSQPGPCHGGWRGPVANAAAPSRPRPDRRVLRRRSRSRRRHRGIEIPRLQCERTPDRAAKRRRSEAKAAGSAALALQSEEISFRCLGHDGTWTRRRDPDGGDGDDFAWGVAANRGRDRDRLLRRELECRTKRSLGRIESIGRLEAPSQRHRLDRGNYGGVGGKGRASSWRRRPRSPQARTRSTAG